MSVRAESVLAALRKTVWSDEDLQKEPDEAALLGLAGGLSIARYEPDLGAEVLELVTNILGSHLGLPGEQVEVILRNAWHQVAEETR